MNRVELIGRLIKDAQIAKTTNGIPTAQFTIAVTRSYKNKKGEYESDFINCVAFRGTAEIVEKYIKKGNLVSVEGRLQIRNYEDKNKVKHYVTEVMVENIMLLERKKQEVKEVQEVNEFDAMNTKTDYQDTVVLQDVDIPF